MAASKQPLTLADMNALAADQFSAIVPVVAQALQQATTNNQTIDRNSLYAVELLMKWDGQLQSTSIAASIYQSFMQTLVRRLIEPTLGRDMATEYMERWPQWLSFAHYVLQNKPVAWLPPEERTYDSFLQTTLDQSLKSLRIAFDTSNPAEWSWGKVHQAVFKHPADRDKLWFSDYFRLGPIGVGGAPECVNSCDVTIDPGALSYQSNSGPTERLIMDMSDHSKFYQAIGTGQSGNLMSPFRRDQLADWLSVDLLPVAFSPDQVMRQSRSRLVLEPE
jgi:penicillin amidase